MTECDTCIRSIDHNGACYKDRKRNGSMCLGYQEDQRGEKRYFRNVLIKIPWGKEIKTIAKNFVTKEFYEMPDGCRNLHIERINTVKLGGNEDLRINVDGWYWSKGTKEEKEQDLEQEKIDRAISYTKLEKKNLIDFDTRRNKKKEKW